MRLYPLEALIIRGVPHHLHPVSVGDVGGKAAQLLLLLLLLGPVSPTDLFSDQLGC